MILWIAVIGCSKDTLKTPEAFEHIYGVEHQFRTLGVEDMCFDGALEILFMPEGSEEPHEFEYPIYMPMLEETPYEDSVDFREPFVGMNVEIVGAESGVLSIADSVMPAVALGNSFGDCTATMTVTADFIPDTTGFSGTADIVLSNLQSSESSCPVPGSETCTVRLQLSSEPLE